MFISTNIRLGWYAVDNTLAYYKHSLTIAINSLITLLPQFMNFHNKLERLSLASLSCLFIVCGTGQELALDSLDSLIG
jgi:hypothetical protein